MKQNDLVLFYLILFDLIWSYSIWFDLIWLNIYFKVKKMFNLLSLNILKHIFNLIEK